MELIITQPMAHTYFVNIVQKTFLRVLSSFPFPVLLIDLFLLECHNQHTHGENFRRGFTLLRLSCYLPFASRSVSYAQVDTPINRRQVLYSSSRIRRNRSSQVLVQRMMQMGGDEERRTSDFYSTTSLEQVNRRLRRQKTRTCQHTQTYLYPPYRADIISRST
jgi:hypothetical protein